MTEVRVPKLGLTMEDCVLVAWLVEPGQAVAAGAPLCEIETDKIEEVVESPVAGTVLALHAEEGDELDVGALVAEIQE
jgi:pyruvate/2-oxoglutarate dehydrogenase complex dihydrolipoamide acyltransferase (E2) component